MVKVECDGCGSPYTVSEKRIPDGGLKMRCPKCGSTFLVTKTGKAGAEPATPAPKPAAPAPKPAAPAPKPAAPAPAPAAAAVKSPAAFGEDADLPARFEPNNLPSVASAARAGAAPRPGGAPRAPQAPRTAGLPQLDARPAAATARRQPDRSARAVAPGAALDLDDGLPSPTADRDRDLPAARPAAQGGIGDEFDLPMPVSEPRAGDLGLDSDLPELLGDSAALPAPARDRDLPTMARKAAVATAVGLGATMRSLGAPPPPPAKPPIFTRRGPGGGEEAADAGGDAFGVLDLGLPGEAELGGPGRTLQGHQGPDADLPVAAEADLPQLADGNLPQLAQGNLPQLADGNLPTLADAGLPTVSRGNLPQVAEAGLPLVSTGNLPVAQAAGLPVVSAGNLPIPQPAGLPLVSAGNLPLVQPPGLPTLTGGKARAADAGADGDRAQPPRKGAGMDIGLEDLPPASPRPRPGEQASDLRLGPAVSEAIEVGEADAVRGIVGGEYEIEDAARGGVELGDAGKPASGPGAMADEEAPLVPIAAKRSRALRIVVMIVVLLAIGGGLLSFTPLGAFGAYAISDAVNQSKHEQALADERKRAQTELEEDTAAAAKAALEQAKRTRAQMPRYAPLANYTTYLAFAKSLRFGADSQDKALGKQLLDTIGAKAPGETQTLARAAVDAVDGQLARARQAVEGLSSSRPDDVDVAVLAGEIALSAKTPKPALQLWGRAVKLRKSARTLFGLARAELAAGDSEQAEKTAREVLQLSPKHAGARTLAAGVLWREQSREQEAVKLLEEVTNTDGPVGGAASSSELAVAHCQLGEIHLARSRMTAAEKEFASALKLEPQAEQALNGNGELFYRSGRYTEAQARFEAALRVNPDSIDAKIGTAKTWLAQERPKDAKELMQKVVAAGSKDPLVGYWQGQAEEALGNRAPAEAAYRRAIKDGGTDPRSVSAYVALANLLTSQGKADEGNAVLTEASGKLPRSPQLALAKGDVALQAGRLDEAKVEFARAIELDPQNLGSKFKLGVALRRNREVEAATKLFDEVSKIDAEYPGLALEWGLLYEATGQTDRALQMYSEALKRAPNDVDLKLRVGSTQVVSGHAKQAVGVLREVLAARPESAEANHFLGRALLVLHTNLSEAQRFLKRATEADPNRAEYFLYYGWALNDAGQPGEAEKALNRALELDKNLGDVYWQRGVLLQKRGATRDALDELKIALQKKPSRVEAYATMALCYSDQNDNAATEQAWRKAIEGNGEVAEWHYRLGKLLNQKGKSSEVITELTRAIELFEQGEGTATPPWLHDAHFLLAEALRSSDRQKALAHYTRFLELAPSDNAYRRDAERAVEQLKTPRP